MTGLLFLGFLIGMRHAIEADHVAAVASLATRSKTPAECIRQGVFWGAGHTFTLFLFGTIVLMLDSVVPERFAAGLELAVGVMLVLLGADVLRRLRKDRVHFHTHEHEDGTRHFHAHSHAGQQAHGPAQHRHVHLDDLRPFTVGIVHGMAGSAALVLLTVERTTSIGAGMLYMLVFGTGSILGMAILSAIIAVPLRVSAGVLDRFHEGLQWAVGLGTMTLGLATIYASALSAMG
jgi:ABC-type nickel/cobalt efflux system permease component RcnA